MKVHPDDPKLTAYALGELDSADRADVEALLAESAEAREALEEIRQATSWLSEELQKEPCPALSDAQRERLVAAGPASQPAPRRAAPRPTERVPLFAGWFRFLAYGAAALALLGVATSLVLPSLSRGKARAQRTAFAPGALNNPVSSPAPLAKSEVAVAYSLADPAPVELAKLQQNKPAGASPVYSVNAVGHASLALNLEFQADTWAPLAEGSPPFNTEGYDRIVDNAFRRVTDHPLSTFSIDVDTASYANVRRFLRQGQRPPPDAVRLEELINYFTYDYPQPITGHPFSVNLEVAACPWNLAHRLVRVGLKGREIAPGQRPPTHLVFLIDVSGSMQPPNKLPLLKEAMRLLVGQLTENDLVSLAVYAGNSGLVLPPTRGDRKPVLLEALARLEAGGSTHGSAGVQLAYEQASAHFIRGGVNRVILCTDGDFNVGVTSQGDLTRLIEEKAKTGVFLSVLGFGMGNLKDSTMEKLADKGNGNYAYIDTLNEARKVLVEQMNGTLVTIAKDVKIQVEFNPARVNAYRLVGYENRLLRKEDFNDDTKDAGEIGAGHTVTALYEIVPAGQSLAVPGVDPLKYQTPPQPATPSASDELLNLKLRYKAPDGDVSQLIETPVRDGGLSYSQASPDFKFAAAVAGFGMILRDSPHKGGATLDAVVELAEEGKGRDPHGYRAEFIELVKKSRRVVRPNP